MRYNFLLIILLSLFINKQIAAADDNKIRFA